jgi:hypothetical protein
MRELKKVIEMDPRKNQEATHVAHDATGTARRIGVSQPSISRRPKARAERVLSVEAVMDDARAILWPDLCDERSDASDLDATRGLK